MISWLKSIYHWFVAVGALLYFRFPARHLTVIGVTGTDGKTTTTTLIYEILKAAGYKTSVITTVHAVIAGKSYDTGFHVTTPNAFFVQKYLREAVDHGDTHVVLETTSHALAQSRVFGIHFTVGVLTNVTHEHLDFHKTYERYLMTKMRLLLASDTAVINKDEGELYAKIAPLLRKHKLVTYGLRRQATITPETHPFETSLPGDFNRYNCLAAIAAASLVGVKKDVIKKAIKGFAGIPGRMEIMALKPCRIIVDFAHTPNAIDKALKTARDSTKGRLIHVFGSAGLRDRSKRPYMGKASAQYADSIVLTEEDYRTESVEAIMDEIASGIPVYKDVHRFANRLDAIKFALTDVKKDDTVIITGKGHEKSLCRGTVEYPWSDQEAVKKLLKK